jgi:hypothetical protein
MAELIVVGFKNEMFRASEALNMLKNMNSSIPSHLLAATGSGCRAVHRYTTKS